MAREEPLTLQSLSPDVVEAARAAAAASGLTLDEWLNRTILGIVGGFAAARNGGRRAEPPEGRWADPLSSISQNLKTAADAASAAGVSFEQWLSQAILTNTTPVAQQGRSSEEPDLSLFRNVPPRPASARVVPIRAELTVPTAAPAKTAEVAPTKTPVIAPVAEPRPPLLKPAAPPRRVAPPPPGDASTPAPAAAPAAPPERAPVVPAPATTATSEPKAEATEPEAETAATEPETAPATPPHTPERPTPTWAKETPAPPGAHELVAQPIPELPSFPDIPTPEPFQPRVHTEIPDVVVAPPRVPSRPSPLFEPGFLNELAETPPAAPAAGREPSFGPAKADVPSDDKAKAEPRFARDSEIPALPSEKSEPEAEDVSVPDAVLDKRLAQIIADARAEVAAMARNAAQTPQPPALPIQPTVAGAGPARARPRSRGGPWLTVAALLILAVVAAAVWVLPKLPQLGVQFEKKPDYVQQLPSPNATARREPASVDKIETLPLTRPGESERPTVKAAPLPEPASQHVEVYRQAATAGNVKAQLALAQLYLRGDGVSKDPAEAARWYREAAEHNDANAQYALGVLLERGIGVDKDPIQALLWFQRAAQQGHPAALTNTGVAYSMGQIVPRDYAKAFSYFQRAADAGVAQAQFNLGLLYENGLGVEKNPVMAYRWYSAAAAGGDSGSTQALERLTATLSADDLARAKDLVRQAAGKP